MSLQALGLGGASHHFNYFAHPLGFVLAFKTTYAWSKKRLYLNRGTEDIYSGESVTFGRKRFKA